VQLFLQNFPLSVEMLLNSTVSDAHVAAKGNNTERAYTDTFAYAHIGKDSFEGKKNIKIASGI